MVARHSQNLNHRPSPNQKQANRPMWEYHLLSSQDVRRSSVFSVRDRAEIEDYLNALGRAGWEVINLDFRESSGQWEFFGIAKRRVGGEAPAET